MRAVTEICDGSSPISDTSTKEQAHAFGIKNYPEMLTLQQQEPVHLLTFDAQVLHIIFAAGTPIAHKQQHITINRTSVECTRSWMGFPKSPAFAHSVCLCESAFCQVYRNNTTKETP